MQEELGSLVSTHMQMGNLYCLQQPILLTVHQRVQHAWRQQLTRHEARVRRYQQLMRRKGQLADEVELRRLQEQKETADLETLKVPLSCPRTANAALQHLCYTTCTSTS